MIKEYSPEAHKISTDKRGLNGVSLASGRKVREWGDAAASWEMGYRVSTKSKDGELMEGVGWK